MKRTIIQRSRKRCNNHVTIVIEITADRDVRLIIKDFKKAFRQAKHLLNGEMSFHLIINQGNSHQEE